MTADELLFKRNGIVMRRGSPHPTFLGFWDCGDRRKLTRRGIWIFRKDDVLLRARTREGLVKDILNHFASTP